MILFPILDYISAEKLEYIIQVRGVVKEVLCYKVLCRGCNSFRVKDLIKNTNALGLNMKYFLWLTGVYLVHHTVIHSTWVLGKISADTFGKETFWCLER